MTKIWPRSLFTRDDSRRARSARRRLRPAVEVFEDRLLLSALYTVNTLTDDSTSTTGHGINNIGDLRYCINQANQTGGTIEFSVAAGTLQLDAPLPALAADIAIEGEAASQVTIQGHGLLGDYWSIFKVLNTADVTISGLTIARGKAQYGGGIDNEGTLTLTGCTVSECYGRLAGGGISNKGTLTMNDSTISGDTAIVFGHGYGGGIFNGGTGTATLIDSTISGDSGKYGGGITNGGQMTVTGCTVANNVVGGRSNASPNAGIGGGILNGGTLTLTGDTLTANTGGGLDDGEATVSVINSIISGNFHLDGTTPQDISGPVNTSASFNNLIGTGGAGGLSKSDGHGNQVNVADPGLGPLSSNGGLTQTVPLLPGSPAIDAGNNALAVDPSGNPLVDDQRGAGFPRIVDGTVDIGAFEVQAPASTTVLTSSAPTSTYGHTVTFTATVTAGGRPATAGSVTFLDGTTVLAADVPLNANGQASCSNSTLINTAGPPHDIVANYSGSGSAAPAALPSSSSLSETIRTAYLTATVVVSSKTYDGTTAATIVSETLDGLASGAPVSLTGGVATFADMNAGTGKVVTVTGLSLLGNYGFNYALTNDTVTTTANITRRSITGSVTVASKVYDGTSAATITGRSLAGVLKHDVVSYVGGAATFDTKNAEAGKTVTATGLKLAGTDARNYIVNTTATTTASITRRALTVTAIGENKVYDGTTAATVMLADNRIAGDQLTETHGAAAFEGANVGVGKTITVARITISGPDAANYTVNPTATATASITKANQTIVWASPAAVGLGTPLGAAQLDATVAGVPGGSAPGALTYTPGPGIILPAGTHEALTITAAATANYNAAVFTVYINVLTAAQQAAILTQDVASLVNSMTLTSSQGHALTVDLALMGNSADTGKVNAFINQVNVFLTNGTLTSSEAEPMIAGAEALLVTLKMNASST